MSEVVKCLVGRRSCKEYLPRQVDEAALQEILLAGTYAPSGKNRQAAKILVLQKPEDIAAVERLNAAVLGNPDGRPFYGAPTVLVVLADPEVNTAVEDGSLVMGNLMNAAHSLGVASCWIHRAREVFDSEEGRALLRKWGVTGEYIGVGHCLLGYADGPEKPASPRKSDYGVRV